MISVWEKESFLQYDYVIVGAGITGLFSALELRRIVGRQPSIVILEKDIIPTGASTRNAGFACFGSFTEILDDITNFGEKAALQLVEDRYRGIQQLLQHFSEDEIGIEKNGGYELLFEKDLDMLARLDEVNRKLSEIFGDSPYSIVKGKIKDFGFKGVANMLHSPFEFQINSGLLVKSLQAKCLAEGIPIKNGCKVIEIEDTGPQVILYLKKGIKLHSKKVAVCTNAYTSALYPKEDIQPGRGMILLTSPIDRIPFRGSFHFDKGFYYFRNYKNRLLIGGGRNIDPEQERTVHFGINSKIYSALMEAIKRIILPGERFDIENSWSGIMAFGQNKLPIVKNVSENVVLGVRLGGMGVALGSQLGQKIAKLITAQK